MCLYISEVHKSTNSKGELILTPHYAKGDLLVNKVLLDLDGKLTSPWRHVEWNIGKEMKANILVESGITGKYHLINQGLHAYINPTSHQYNGLIAWFRTVQAGTQPSWAGKPPGTINRIVELIAVIPSGSMYYEGVGNDIVTTNMYILCERDQYNGKLTPAEHFELYKEKQLVEA